MYRRLIAAAALAGAALIATACHPMRHGWSMHSDRPMTVAATLTCPPQQGHLVRVSATPDGKNCVYRGNQDEEVDLGLTPLQGEPPQQALTPTETMLHGLAPKPASAAKSRDDGWDGDNDEHRDRDQDGDHAQVDGPFVHVDADDRQGHDRAKVDAPFIHVDTDDDHAHVKVFGVTIDADNDNANVHTDWGSKSAVIKAGPGGAEIRTQWVQHGDADLAYILASDTPGPGGFRTVGYFARGPSAGPLVVAVFKSTAQHRHHFHDSDIDDLIRLNVHQ